MTEHNSITDFNSFSNFLNSLREKNDHLGIEEVKQAKIIAESLENKNQIPHALDYLKSETTKFGTNEAKYFYSYGSELKLNSLLKGIPDNEKQDYIKKIFSGKDVITLDFVKKLSPEDQSKIIKISEAAAAWYNEIAGKKRSARPPEESIAREILNFTKYIQNLPG